MQCKDIPDEPVLRFLAVHGGIGCTLWRNEDGTPMNARSAIQAMPDGVPWKLANAKMAMLMRRGLVDGCPCGCRGDWELTPAGRAWLAQRETPNVELSGKRSESA